MIRPGSPPHQKNIEKTKKNKKNKILRQDVLVHQNILFGNLVFFVFFCFLYVFLDRWVAWPDLLGFFCFLNVFFGFRILCISLRRNDCFLKHMCLSTPNNASRRGETSLLHKNQAVARAWCFFFQNK